MGEEKDLELGERQNLDAEENDADYDQDDLDEDDALAGQDGPKSPVQLQMLPETNPPRTLDRPIFPILAYCGSSILMTLTNKYVLSGHNFNLNFFLLAVQGIICVVVIQTCKTFAVISYRDFSSDQAKKWFPIAFLLVGMIYTGTKALQYLTIPAYTIFKNLTIILIAYGEVLWFGGSVTRVALASFLLMCLSSVVAAWADIQAALQPSNEADDSSDKISTLNIGYIWMFLNCFCTAAFVLGMRKRIKLTNFKDFDTMFYNNLLSIPILIVCSLAIEDWSAGNLDLNFPTGNRTASFFAILVSGISAVCISYTTAWCVRVTTSTTFSMVGALNKLPIALSGLIFFDAPVTPASISAIALGIFSGVIYTVDKTKNGKKQSQPPNIANGSQRNMHDDRARSESAGFLNHMEVEDSGIDRQRFRSLPLPNMHWRESFQTLFPRKS